MVVNVDIMKKANNFIVSVQLRMMKVKSSHRVIKDFFARQHFLRAATGTELIGVAIIMHCATPMYRACVIMTSIPDVSAML